MIFVKEHRRFSELCLGFISLGLGQLMIGFSFIQPILEGRRIQLGWFLVSCVLLLLGVFLLGRILYWLFRTQNQENRLLKTFGYGFLALISVGFILGFLGQLIYDHTSISYDLVKQVIWAASTYLQLGIRLTLIHVLLAYLQKRSPSWKDQRLHLLLKIGCLGATISVLVAFLFPPAAAFLQYLLDTSAVLGPVYYFLVKK